MHDSYFFKITLGNCILSKVANISVLSSSNFYDFMVDAFVGFPYFTSLTSLFMIGKLSVHYAILLSFR